jgi:hypothetical protein
MSSCSSWINNKAVHQFCPIKYCGLVMVHGCTKMQHRCPVVTYTTEEPYKECYTRFISKFQITLASFRNFKISLVILK